jgi:hypothetical protein
VLLPGALEIIGASNRRFLDEVHARFPGGDARVAQEVEDTIPTIRQEATAG